MYTDGVPAPAVFGLPLLAAAPVAVRHVSRGTGTGAVTVLGASFIAQRKKGANGLRGFQSGSYETMLSGEGTATLSFPNATGDDGVLHRRRFAILTDSDYHPGDEWLEILQDGRVLFVGTPIDRELTRTTLTLTLADGLWMANTQRETAAGFWAHAPRDVFEHYTKAWVPIVADDFTNGADPAKWTLTPITFNIAGGGVRVRDGGKVTARADYWGATGLGTQRAWRLEATLAPTTAGRVGGSYLRMVDASGAPRISVFLSGSYVQVAIAGAGATDTQTIARASGLSNTVRLAIEVRDRVALFYVAGQLIHTMEVDVSSDIGAMCVPEVAAGAGVQTEVDVHDLLLRRCDPYLTRGQANSDLRLPGILPSGGLKGTYHDEADLRPLDSATTAPGAAYYRRVLSPTRRPYARRQDAEVNFPVSVAPTWQSPTPPSGEYFSVRWTGAIYLDLTAADVTLQLSQWDDAVRVWVGRTMHGQQLLDSWVSGGGFKLTSASLRAHLGTSMSGWYPLRIDYANAGGNGGIVFERSVGGAAYEVVPSSALSPLGIYEAEVRYDSHAEQLKAVALAYGLQYRCEPRTLESGEFPGSVVAKVRVGRDTDKILKPAESTEVSVKGSANEVIDTLYADAAGLGDQANAAQLTAESINFQALAPGARMMVLSAYESLADITDPVLLQTRIASMLGLRITPWEEISARPRGHRELRDTFPMTGAIAAFAWEPGDGLRVVDDALDLRDLTPRQITGMTWPFGPDGLGAPSARFRQRPRTQQDAMRALVRATLLPQRNYQGQLAIVSGTQSSFDATGYTVVKLPRDLTDVKRCELVVGYKSDTSTWTIKDFPAAAAIATFATVGRIDLLPFLNRRSDTGGPEMVVSAVGGTGAANYALELVVSV